MSWSRLAAVIAWCGITACSSSQPTPAPEPAVRTRMISTSDSFSPRTGDAAIAAFIPEVAPVDSGGECSITRTGGNGATMASAGFPRRINAHTNMSITFDSAGRMIRFSERRGGIGPRFTAGLNEQQRDSVLRASLFAARATMISFDYAIDQAVVANQGGGRPTDAVLGPVRSFENLEKLGPPRARIERLRRLCGV